MHYLRLFDSHGAPTPRIEQMASDGLTFTHAFSNSPVCSVARTTLMTSCHAPRIFTQFHRRSVVVPLPGDLRMFPAYLRDAGYYATNRHKKDYNAVEGPGVWDESSRNATWRKRSADQPFFHMQSFGTTHESSLHFSASEMERQATRTDVENVHVAPYHPDTPLFRYTNARYRDNIQMVDQQIGEVLDSLEADGVLEDTFVFYFGDHGGVLPRGKGYAYESGLHVPLVIRVPQKWKHLIDFNRGEEVAGFVSFVDFGPTLLHMAGIDLPDEIDGTAFLGPDITREQVNKRDQAFGYADRFDEKYDFVRTVRKGRFEYVRSYQPFNFDGLQNNYRYRMLAYQEWRDLYNSGDLNEVQSQFFRPRSAEALFDIATDPHETKNLADDPGYAEKLRQMRDLLASQVKTLPDLSFFPEHVLVKHAASDPVSFGQAHKSLIADLVDIADLSLPEFEKARERINDALRADNPWKRYWGLIVCSSHGKDAAVFADTAIQIAAEDPEPLVRVRAAEFLGLIGAADPQSTIVDVLTKTADGVEAALVLNSLVLLRDGEPSYSFRFERDDLKPAVRQNDSVTRRLEYLGID